MFERILTDFVWASNIGEAVLLYRAIRGRFFGKYPVFYIYLAYVFAYEVAAFCVYTFDPGFYSKFYWGLQYVSITIGYCVIWEVYRQVFKPYPGASRIARALLAGILIFVVCKVILNGVYNVSLTSVLHRAPEYERYLRVVQAALLVTIVALIAYYSIPIGRNLKGMILGYGLYIGLTIMQLGLRAYLGEWFQPIWKHLAWVSYTAALVTWCVTLWSYQPSPEPTRTGPEYDYQQLATQTSRMMSQVRSGISRAMRP
jgi:hypothetical protein